MSCEEDPLRIAFVIEGGSESGMGHIMRCAALAREAKARGHRVAAILEAEAAVCRAWQEASNATRIADREELSTGTFADILFIDVPGDKSAWLDRAARHGIRTIVLDDRRAVDRADRTICPALHEEPFERLPLLAGPRWSILAPPHRRVRTVARKDRLLVTLGGADPHHVTPRIAPALMKIMHECGPGHGFGSFDIVLGPAFRDHDGSITETLERGGWTVHHSLCIDAMAQLMAESRLAVCGFGTSLTELAAHRTPHLTITQHAVDVAAAKYLESRGIGKHLGFAGDLDLGIVDRLVSRAVEDEHWRQQSAARAFEAIEGGSGVERVIDQAEAIAGRARRTNEKSGQPGGCADRFFRSSTRSAARSMSSPSKP